MECLLLVLDLCFFQPANIYLSVNLDYAFNTREVSRREEFVSLDPVRPTLIQNVVIDRSYVANDHARITLGWTVYESRTLAFDFGLVHGSSPSVKDHGYEGAFVGVTWRPFK